jgi:DNA-binding response OmpR family regulator
LLVVEDDPTIGQALSSSLGAHGYEVVWCTEGQEAARVAGEGAFDLVLLDLGLPDRDGVALCRELRARQRDAVIVMLTARDDEMDVIIGLEAGADDYLTKPVRLAELHARIRAHLRRVEAVRPAGDEQSVKLGDLVIDLAARRVTVAGQDLSLRAKEFDLLARLAAQPGAAISREVLMADVWDANWFGSTKTLDVHVAALRKRLQAVPDGARLPVIITLRGHGYRLDVPAHRPASH